jgi:DDE superfamily endonuclease/Tc5 transposase DNA-binding domain/helix-turn-helix, Psq domain
MTKPRSLKAMETEARINQAVEAYNNGDFKSILATAQHFEVNRNTLTRRVSGHPSRVQARQSQQLLSPVEESVLVKWICQLSCAGHPARHQLIKEMAEEIRVQRVQNVNDASTRIIQYPPIGKEWIQRFITRHLELQTIAARQIESARHQDATHEALQHWFTVLESKFLERNYDLCNIYNMDESGFGIGTSQTNRVVVDATMRTHWKLVPGRQEWVSVIECISADKCALPPLVIFKATTIDSAWSANPQVFNWRFSASTKGWTSNVHGLQWLQWVFEPETREKASGKPRLLIADGHDSHITGNFIAHCMQHNIDLLILPPHCSHILQPLDVGVFGPLKTALSVETDQLTRTSMRRIQKVEWIEMYYKARMRAISSSNIEGAWRGAGIYPLNPQKAYSHLPNLHTRNSLTSTNATTPPTTPNHRSLLLSSPPTDTELRSSNAALNLMLSSQSRVDTPMRKYISRLTRTTETLTAQNTLLLKELQESQSVLAARKARKKGKRVALKGVIVMSTKEIQSAVSNLEEENRKNKAKKRTPRTQRKDTVLEIEDDLLIDSCTDSEFGTLSCIIIDR